MRTSRLEPDDPLANPVRQFLGRQRDLFFGLSPCFRLFRLVPRPTQVRFSGRQRRGLRTTREIVEDPSGGH